ncbi:CBD9-like protein [Trichodelitschia bisporula]|uniref:CBD9-like protein n=1 Tax=Trichodelitschia bisporula TaxID=703511 RepID=A0A6G1I1Y6_9PEZI|nr:CBD9-like protein [Trichodelitschia bisporula]
MLLSSIVAVFALCTSALAQRATAPFTEPKSGITFQAYKHTSGYQFGIALPPKPGNDFIGHLSAPASVGWAGGDLGPKMVGKLLIVAWPNGGSVVGSLRRATRKSSPPPYTGAAKLKPIAAGTYANASHWSYTFLCEGCLADPAVGFAKDAPAGDLGWAAGARAPADKASANAGLSYHNVGAGSIQANFAQAKATGYDAWAAKAA